MTTKSLEDVFRDDLRDPEFVEEYIQAALEESGPEGVITALRRIAAVRASEDSLPLPSDKSFASVYETMTALGLNFRVVRANKSEVSA